MDGARAVAARRSPRAPTALLIEVHPCPAEAWCDADQALSIDEFTSLMARLDAVARAIGRNVDHGLAANDPLAA